MIALTPTDFRLLQRALSLAASYADSDSDETAILELSDRISRDRKTVPDSADAHAAVTATIAAIKRAGRREPLTPQILDRIASELIEAAAPSSWRGPAIH